MVTNHMGRNVQDSDVYIFINRPRTSMKILYMEWGVVISHMKLESGTFKLPAFDQIINTFQTTWRDLMTMVKGITTDENAKKIRRKYLNNAYISRL